MPVIDWDWYPLYSAYGEGNWLFRAPFGEFNCRIRYGAMTLAVKGTVLAVISSHCVTVVLSRGLMVFVVLESLQ